eukprot:TRINITY_DN25035_c0_g1_i2.p1 TRINITY_DN25035_c0_g1~~TRINITY_DN25035_c0_g1_i2.p1  ORF type:complete len:161 (+),score=41.49 TRINITY_DN25035_c0_g1_i2:42-485(+)
MSHGHSHGEHGHSHGRPIRRPPPPAYRNEQTKNRLSVTWSQLLWFVTLTYLAYRLHDYQMEDIRLKWGFWCAYGCLLPMFAGYDVMIAIGRKEGRQQFLRSTLPLVLGLCLLSAILFFFVAAGGPEWGPLTAACAELAAFFYLTTLI